MKKLFFNLLCLLFVVAASAQSTVTLTGTITKISDGSPVANWIVYAYAGDSLNFVYGDAQTNANGVYTISFAMPIGFSDITVNTETGCPNPGGYVVSVVTPVNGIATANFEVCDVPPPPGCWASADYSGDPAGNPLSFWFSGYYYAFDSTQYAVSYLWDFGDGSSSTAANPNHVYAASGQYVVTLTVTGSDGCTATTTLLVYAGDVPPFESCAAYINSVPTGDSLTFAFTSYFFSYDDSTSVAVSYLWDFGDGSTSTAANPTHTYAQSGFYEVHLHITSSTGCLAEAVFFLSTDFPPAPACEAYIFYNQTDTLSFDFDAIAYGMNSNPWDTTGTTILAYHWDFGDGTTSTAPTPSHTYAQEGIYSVQLTVVTEDSCEAHACSVVFAYDTPVDTFLYGCQAMFGVGFDLDSTIGNPVVVDPLTVHFYDYSFGGALTWSWNFGDSTGSNLQNPTHTYAQEGTYTVTLTIITSNGCESAVSFQIYVGNNAPWTPELDCQALFIPLPDSLGGNGLQFFDLSYAPNPIITWSWDFGDGTTSNEQNPYHVYSQPGIYTVSLTITADSCNSVISYHIDTEHPWNFSQVPALFGLAGGTSSTKNLSAFDSMKAYPNPASTDLSITFAAKKAGDYILSITDLSGKVLSETQQNAVSGANLLRVPVQNLVPGFYLAQLRTADRVQTIKFVKQ